MADIVIDKTDLTAVKLAVAKLRDESPTAIRLATNETLQGVVTDSVEAIRIESTINSTTIRRNFSMNKMTVKNLNAYIDCVGEPAGLIHYGPPTQVQAGIKVRLWKDGERDLVKHAFLTRFSSGHRAAVWRAVRRKGTRPVRFAVGKRTKVPSPQKRSGEMIRGGVSTFQLPIHELYGPRVPDLLANDEVFDIVLRGANVRFQKRLEYQTNRLIESARA